MFKAPKKNKWGAVFYGTAGISAALGGGEWDAAGCGKCFKLTGDSLADFGKRGARPSIVVRATNFCGPGNSQCENGKSHFNIAAPGFDFDGASQNNSCKETYRRDRALHPPQTCGRWMINSQNPDENCRCGRIRNKWLMQGCRNFLSLGWDNNDLDYEEVECPKKLARIPCWKENGNQWPRRAKGFCKKPKK